VVIWFFFAGGLDTGVSDAVEIYNVQTKTWSRTTLTQPRWNLAAAASGYLVLFAGGCTDLGCTAFSNVVDIYNTKNYTWTTATLSQARGSLAGAASGNIVVFTGGVTSGSTNSAVVDIYNALTNTWTNSTLGSTVAWHVGTSSENLILFGGGCVDNYCGTLSSNIFIYNTIPSTIVPTSSPLSGPTTIVPTSSPLSGPTTPSFRASISSHLSVKSAILLEMILFFCSYLNK